MKTKQRINAKINKKDRAAKREIKRRLSIRKEKIDRKQFAEAMLAGFGVEVTSDWYK